MVTTLFRESWVRVCAANVSCHGQGHILLTKSLDAKLYQILSLESQDK